MAYLFAFMFGFLAVIGSAQAQTMPGASPPQFIFTDAQVKVIAEVAIQKRDAAAAEYRKWDEIIAEIMRQAQEREKAKEAGKTP